MHAHRQAHRHIKYNDIGEITPTAAKGHVTITTFPKKENQHLGWGSEPQEYLANTLPLSHPPQNPVNAFQNATVPGERSCVRQSLTLPQVFRWPVVEEDPLEMEYGVKMYEKAVGASQRKTSMPQYFFCETPEASVEHISIMFTKMFLRFPVKTIMPLPNPDCYHKLPAVVRVFCDLAKT